MKRFFSALLITGMALGMAAQAEAKPEVKIGGFLQIAPYYLDGAFHSNRSPNTEGSRFNVGQRMSLQMQFIANENVYGFLDLRSDQLWGDTNSGSASFSRGGGLGDTEAGLYTKYAFMDFMVPETDLRVRMGIQPMVLPGYVAGSAILDTNVAGIAANYQVTESIGVGAFWLRPYDTWQVDDSSTDLFGLSMPVTTAGFNITPWGAFGMSGRNSDMRTTKGYSTPAWVNPAMVAKVDDNATLWWAGLTGEIKLWNPFRMAFDINYGSAKGYADSLDRSGWLFSALAEYSTAYGVPGVLGWYSTGDKGNIDGGSNRMPTLMPSWEASSFGFDGNFASRNDGSGLMGDSPVGTWGVMLRMKDIPSIEKMKHVLRVGYYRGTNSENAVRRGLNVVGAPQTLYNQGTNGIYLSKKDAMWEANFDSVYQMYNNFQLALEIGYLRLQLDEALWNVENLDKNAYRAALTFAYNF